MKKRASTVLKELVLDKEILFRPGAALPMHAQMVEAAGFKAVGISGASAGVELFGLPDAGLVTATEVIQNIANTVRAVDIPVMADCDTGYGPPIHVRRTIAGVIRTGAAGCFLEDQEFPPRCALVSGANIASLDDACAMLEAAIDQRNMMDEDFQIMARTDARNAPGGGMEAVIERAKAYFDVGVDVVLAAGLRNREEIAQLRAAVDGPISASCHIIRPYPTLEEMSDMGIAMTTGINWFKAGFVTQWDMITDLKKRGVAAWAEFLDETREHPLGSYGTFDLTGFPTLVEWEKKYTPEAEFAEKYDDSHGDYDPRVGRYIKGRRLAF